MLAAKDANDVGRVHAKFSAQILCIKIDLNSAADSKNLYISLTTQSQSVHRSICGDVGLIQFKIETKAVSQFV